MVEALHSIGFTDAMITSSVITIAVTIICIIVSRNLKVTEAPGLIQNMIELGLEKNHNFFRGVMGDYLGKKYYPLVGTLFIYILLCNYSGLLPFAGHAPGFQAPTSDINFPAGLAICVFVLLQVFGIKEHRGLGTYKRMFQPFVFIFPLMLMDEIIHPVSLTFRLYGNTYGDEQVIHTFFNICPLGLPVVMQFLTVLLALIQALVFSLLTGIYLVEACEGAEELQ